jgi:hypothetical protein
MDKTGGISQQPQRLLIYSVSSNQLVSTLSQGEELDARVIRHIDSNKVLISIKNLEVTAQSKTPFKEGDIIKVKVESLTPRIVLKLISRNMMLQNAFQKIVNSMGASNASSIDLINEISKLLATGDKELQLMTNGKSIIRILTDIMKIFDLTQSGFTSETLKKIFQNFTLSFENELKQLITADSKSATNVENKDSFKYLLLKLLGLLSDIENSGNDMSSFESTKLMKTAKGLLQNIDLQHIQNRLSDSGPYHFEIPIIYSTENNIVDVIMDFPNREKEEGSIDDFSITLLLKLTALGKIRVNILTKGKKVYTSISLTDQSKTEFLRSNLLELLSRFEKIGYNSSDILVNLIHDPHIETYNLDELKNPQNIPIIDFHV